MSLHSLDQVRRVVVVTKKIPKMPIWHTLLKDLAVPLPDSFKCVAFLALAGDGKMSGNRANDAKQEYFTKRGFSHV